MEGIGSLLKNRTYQQTQNARVNAKYERAVEFLSYLNLPTDKGTIFFLMKMCKVYGAGKVYGTKSYLKDMRVDEHRWKGLLVWKLQQMQTTQKTLF